MPLLEVETFRLRFGIRFLCICPLIITCFLLLSCGDEQCQISTSISPETATADHAAASPGSQAQFSLSSHVSGMCPIADVVGSWSTSDPINTTITASQSDSRTATATCVNATQAPVTISNSGKVRGKAFPTATLTCH